MMNGEGMKNDLPKGLYSDDLNSKSNKDLDIVGKQLDDVESSVLDLEKQFSITTCTWAIDIYEKEYDVRSSAGASLEERRANTLAKSRGGRGTNPAVIKEILQAFTDTSLNNEPGYFLVGESLVGEDPILSPVATTQVTLAQDFQNGHIQAIVDGVLNFNRKDFRNAMRKYIHGHLGVELVERPDNELTDELRIASTS
jgi:hypothetical protein